MSKEKIGESPMPKAHAESCHLGIVRFEVNLDINAGTSECK
jgi:hypothetical protein